MYLTFRWFGPHDPVRLELVRQIPGVEGIVTALHDVPAGDVWAPDALARRAEEIDRAGLRFAVVESIPVHEDIKLGRATRDALIENYQRSICHLGELGIAVLCYNFMPVFDWIRTALAQSLSDGSSTLAYDHHALDDLDLVRMSDLPAWATKYDNESLGALLDAYRAFAPERLWENLAYFLERVVPVAGQAGVKLALHPDDPPWPVLGIPRIVTDGAALLRVTRLVDHPANGITFCTGSLGALATNDLPAMIRALGRRIHFAHCRNVRVVGDRSFFETPHPSRFGDVDMRAALQALFDTGFEGPMRPDHGRMIWGEEGLPGYGLHDRALGAMYLHGLWEGVTGKPPTSPPA
jgi:mannonate dehydratase